MEFRAVFYRSILVILVLVFWTHIFGTPTFPTDLFYLLLLIIGFLVAVLIHGNILDFITVKRNIVTKSLMIAISVALLMYGAEIFVPGFKLGEFALEQTDFGVLTVNSFSLPKYGTIGLVAISIGLLFSFLELLSGNE